MSDISSGKKMKFPENFLWGAATASYQVEGGIENCDWAEAAREGRVPIAGTGDDQYNRYEEDFDLAKSLGHNVHRLSIEWARIEPEEGKFDQDAIEHYKKVLQALNNRGIKPMVTLWHFTLPTWFSRAGGFNQKRAPEIFMKYCLYVIGNLYEYADMWSTMNEPIVWANNGYVRSVWPPFKKNPFQYVGAIHNLIRAHNLVYKNAKKIHPELNIGVVKDNFHLTANRNPFNLLKKKILNSWWNHYFLKRVAKNIDHIGLNYYFHFHFGPSLGLPKNDMGWDMDPEKIGNVLIDLKRYNVDLYVTEAGIPDRKDTMRADYIRGLVRGTYNAIQSGAPVKGFMYWSLIDNYEWAKGFDEEFGLIHINQKTKQRTVRESAYVYKKICEENALTIE